MSDRDIYLSFFMFTTDLQPGDDAAFAQNSHHMRELTAMGYTGFDLPIFPTPTFDHAPEVEAYKGFKAALDRAGLGDVAFTTNVATTRTFDPTSLFADQRQVALDYLKSRVDITAALGGEIMAGPIVFPYNQFPTTDLGVPLWSDQLQDWMAPRYERARPVMEELGEYAAERGIRVAIEPVDHWETPGPNMLGDAVAFLAGVSSPAIGAVVDIAHVVLGSSGPAAVAQAVQSIGDRVFYAQASAPDRGALKDSWIPWQTFLGELLPGYAGPILIEVFNAIPAFLNPLHLTRRKFWIPGIDDPVAGVPDAYTVARDGIETLRAQLAANENGAPR